MAEIRQVISVPVTVLEFLIRAVQLAISLWQLSLLNSHSSCFTHEDATLTQTGKGLLWLGVGQLVLVFIFGSWRLNQPSLADIILSRQEELAQGKQETEKAKMAIESEQKAPA